MKALINLTLLFKVFVLYFLLSNSVAADEVFDGDISRYKSSMQSVLSKNLDFIKRGRFSIRFHHNRVEIFSINDCSSEHKLVDSITLNDSRKYESTKLVDRYLSYLTLSFHDPHGVKAKELSGYYICVLENDDVTTFAFTGGPNSRGGGPIYLINSKSNKLLEVHYMQ